MKSKACGANMRKNAGEGKKKIDIIEGPEDPNDCQGH